MSTDPTAEHIDREPASIVGEFIDDEAMMATGRSIGVVASFRIATALLAEPTMRAALAASLPAEVKAASLTDAEMLAALVDRGTLTEEWRVWFTGSDAPTAPVDEATSRRFTGDHRERRRVTPWEVAE